MCNPVVIPILAGVGAAVTAGGQLYSASAAKQGALYEAKVADRNAKLSQENIQDAKTREVREQQRHWRKVAQQMGTQRANFAASGLDLNFGTPADVVDDTLQMGYEDARTISENTRKEVRGFDIETANYRDSAASARYRGKQAKTAGYFSAAGSLLSGASQVAGSFAPGGAMYKGG